MMGGPGPGPFCGMLLGDLGADVAAQFYGMYAMADGGHIAVGAMEPKFYAELCDRLGVSVPHDGDKPTAWAAHREVPAARFAEKTRDEWAQLLDSPGCPAKPVLSLSEAPRHPHLAARGAFVDALLREMGFDSDAVTELVDAGVVVALSRRG